MPRNNRKILEDRILLSKAQVARLEAAKKAALAKSRQNLLQAHEAGMSQTALAKLWRTSPTRMKYLLAQAMAEKSDHD